MLYVVNSYNYEGIQDKAALTFYIITGFKVDLAAYNPVSLSPKMVCILAAIIYKYGNVLNTTLLRSLYGYTAMHDESPMEKYIIALYQGNILIDDIYDRLGIIGDPSIVSVKQKRKYIIGKGSDLSVVLGRMPNMRDPPELYGLKFSQNTLTKS